MRVLLGEMQNELISSLTWARPDTNNSGTRLEIYLPNDYQTSNGPPVGDCLCSLRRDWLKENCSNNLLIITQMTTLPFIALQ